jgi:hypothetical protein
MIEKVLEKRVELEYVSEGCVMDSFVISDTSAKSSGTIRSTRTRWAEQTARIEDIKRYTEFYLEDSEGGKHT